MRPVLVNKDFKCECVTCVVGARLNKQGCRNGKKKKKNITGELLCKRGNNETAEDFKTANKKRAAFKRKNQESYLNHGLITTDDSRALSPLCTPCSDLLSNEAMKPSKPPHREQAT